MDQSIGFGVESNVLSFLRIDMLQYKFLSIDKTVALYFLWYYTHTHKKKNTPQVFLTIAEVKGHLFTAIVKSSPICGDKQIHPSDVCKLILRLLEQ